MSEIGGEKRVLKIAVINGGLYIVVSLLLAFVLKPDTVIYFSEGFFYIFILATFLSPFILNQIPYFKKLALELQQPNAPHMFKRFLDHLLKPV